MNTAVSNPPKRLKEQLSAFQVNKFTGWLKIKCSSVNDNSQWKLYFCFGHAIWATGGSYPHCLLIRLIAQHCPQIVLDKNLFANSDKYASWNYQVLTDLLKNQKITQKEFASIVENTIQEVISHILKIEDTKELDYIPVPTSAAYLLTSGLNISYLLLDPPIVFQNDQQKPKVWSDCCQKGLESWYPHFVPFLKDKKRLQQEVSPLLYKNIVNLIDGQHTLADLAVKLNKDVIEFSCSLLPYVRSGSIGLKEISDSPPAAIGTNCKGDRETPNSGVTAPKQFRIACIDDSLQITKVMQQILTEEGYEFIGINRPLQAIVQLISSPPDLIFLDIGMPVLNGYELCAQIRRVSQFKEIPIVMLTGHDGIIDRLRTRVVGANSFISKPIDTIKILDTVKRFLLI